MNPSRISTPVDKKIDEWYFRFMGKDIKFNVYIHRERDPQANENRVPKIDFEAKVTEREIEDAKVDEKKFAPASFRDVDINKVRAMCETHCQKMLALKWTKCIVIGFDQGEKRRNDFFSHGKLEGKRMNPFVELKFDFAVAMRSGEHYRYLEDDDDRSYWHSDPHHMLCGWYGEGEITTLAYDEKTLAALERIKDSYLELNRRVGELLRPANIHRLVDSVHNLLPAPVTPPKVVCKRCGHEHIGNENHAIKI